MPETARASRAAAQPEKSKSQATHAGPDGGQPAQGRSPSGLAFPGSSAGRSLAPAERSWLEDGFGVGLGDVRLHPDSPVADAVNAEAFALGNHVYFGAGRYRPREAEGQRLLAHELAHVVQQRSSEPPRSTDSLEQAADRSGADVVVGRTALVAGAAPQGLPQRRPRDGTAWREVDQQKVLLENAERLRTEALPAFQRGLDLVDARLVEDAGWRVLALWMTVAAANNALLPPEAIRAPDAPELPLFAETRNAVLADITIQRFRGNDLLGPQRTVEYITDIGRHVATQTEAAVGTVKDATELVRRLTGRPPSSDDEEAAIGLLAGRPNPWQFAYLQAVVKAEGLGHVLDAFGVTAAEDLRAIRASHEFLKNRREIGPTDRIGVAEPMPTERKVRVLRAYGARELALELYGDYAFYDILLVPYNRALLENLPPTALIPAGTELLIEPQLTHGRYRMVFMAVEMTKRQADRPYIDAAPSGAAIVKTKSRYTLRWPLVEPTPPSLQIGGRFTLWTPMSKLVSVVGLDWYVDNDPAAVGLPGVRAEDWIGSQEVTTAELNKAGSSIDWQWPALGTHTVRCKVRFYGELYMDPIELRYPQPVVKEREKLEAEWPTVDDPRIAPSTLMAQRAETYGEFQRIAAALNVSEDELAHDPALAGRVNTSYYPEFLVRDLRQQLAGTADRLRQRKLRDQIDAVEAAIERTKTWGMRPIRALYVSSDDKQTVSAPLLLYVSPDPEAPAAFPLALRLWDFTLEGAGRAYADGHGAWTPQMAVHGLFDQFGDEAPYPKGIVRFAVDSSLLPDDFAGKYPLAREIYEVHTHGGLLIEKLAGGLLTLMIVGVGIITVGPEVTLMAFAIYGAIMGLADIITRLEAGTFEWDLQTGMDILAIAGGLAAGVSPIISAVRGVGSVAWLGSATRAAGVLQLGVMAGQHLAAIVNAVQSGDNDKIVEAVLAAAIDGALIVVTHKAGSPPEEPQGRTGGGPVSEGKGTGVTVVPRGGEGRLSTAVGIGGERPPGPPGREPALKEGTPAATHEAWTAQVAERGLAPRPGPGQSAGPPVGPYETYETISGKRSFATPEEAFSAYEEALTRAGNREVGVYRNTTSPSGEYVVRVGDELSVSGPAGSNWESVLHKHPNPENVLTRRMPAPQDVQNTLHAAFRSGRPVTEFIDYPLPDGRHGLVAYTVEPVNGRVTIKYETAGGTTVERTFSSVEAYASHYSERTTYVDPSSTEYQWMMRDLHDFYADRPYSGGATARGVLRPGAPTVEGPVEHSPPREGARSSLERRTGRRTRSTAPVVRSRAQLDQATQALEQRIETLKSHPDAPAMADELEGIKRQLRGGDEADASTRITALERRVARARLYGEQAGLERIYGESEKVVGGRVIEYVPKAEGPPLKLDPTSPHPLDATGQKLLSHVRAAIAEFESQGFTDAETVALRSVERGRRSALRDAFRGSHIDRIAKKAIMEDPELEHVYVTVNFERGADFYDSRTGNWYDITTSRAWKQHVADYGPTQPGKTTIPGFRLPTETL